MRGVRNGLTVTLLASGIAAAEPVTVVALGDSLTAGYGLADQSQGLVPVLEGWLKAKGHDVVVQNAGVSGDTTAGGLARIGWALGPDADALIVTLGGMTCCAGWTRRGREPAWRASLKEAAARKLPVLLVAMKAPGNFGPEYKAAFDGMYAELAAQLRDPAGR